VDVQGAASIALDITDLPITAAGASRGQYGKDKGIDPIGQHGRQNPGRRKGSHGRLGGAF
jgi:hypothetical protein